ncbi:MAG TPA: type II toxin-antitoxin system prevent-host-death family antitoxin [Xanthobacteraceae bacterium]|nr:type II toxin-antitoxin system prevent-host-death family antitoxin [Xanthobacteraceae bacterium]
MAKRINSSELRTRFFAVLKRVSEGESFIICKYGKPVALLSPTRRRRKIRFGFMKGKIKFAPDFDDPLPDEILDAFEGRGSCDPI